MVCRRKYHFPK